MGDHPCVLREIQGHEHRHGHPRPALRAEVRFPVGSSPQPPPKKGEKGLLVLNEGPSKNKAERYNQEIDGLIATFLPISFCL